MQVSTGEGVVSTEGPPVLAEPGVSTEGPLTPGVEAGVLEEEAPELREVEAAVSGDRAL